MKKLTTSLLALLVTLSLTCSSIFAIDTAKIDASFQKIYDYCKTQKLTSIDDVISYEALGHEAETANKTFEIKTSDVYSGGNAGKTIVALALQSIDPSDYNGDNYVDILNSYINGDGSVTDTFGASDDIWVIAALYVLSSKKLDKAVEHYIATYPAEKVNYYEGSYLDENGVSIDYSGHDFDTTGLSIAVLSLIDKKAYKDYINTAIDAMKALSKDNTDGSYADPYMGNADTQSSVLTGLLTYNYDGVINDDYNLNNINPFDYLISLQDESGAFTYYGSINGYATNDGARALGAYKNGFYLKKAKDSYKKATTISTRLSTKSYTYNGKAKNPKITVKQNGIKLVKGTDYKVTTPKGRKNVGTYKYTITFLGKYKSFPKRVLTFTINPKKVTIKKVTKYKKKLKVTYKSAGKTVKYQVLYKKKGASKWTKKTTSKLSYTIKGLKRRTKYQIKVRAYGKGLYGSYSKVKTVKTK